VDNWGYGIIVGRQRARGAGMGKIEVGPGVDEAEMGGGMSERDGRSAIQ